MDTDKVIDKALRLGMDEVSVECIERIKRQVRFSNNDIDISKLWIERKFNVFMSQGKRVLLTSISNPGKWEEELEQYAKLIKNFPENKDFNGLNDKKQVYRSPKFDAELVHIDLDEIAKRVIDGALSKGAVRSAGVVYMDYVRSTIATNYNTAEDARAGVDVVIRAFSDTKMAGQEAITTASTSDLENVEEIGERAASIATLTAKEVEGRSGKYDVVFHPLAFGSLMTYSMQMASAFFVDAGMSIFADKLNEKIFSDKLTVYDDPTLFSSGHRIYDEEATATQKTTIVEKGTVKSYLHSHSTAVKFGTHTTGNAGIIVPNPWQIVVEQGTKSYSDLIASIDKGLFIVNLWYTRFQDYRNGDFSTIPRDGIFYVEDGEIKEAWKGIRISENIVSMFARITELSTERHKVKWWDEVLPSLLPYVKIESVNITKSTL